MVKSELTILLAATERHDACSGVETSLHYKRCECPLVYGQDQQLSPPY